MRSAKLFLVALGVFFPLYINTFHGIRSVDRGLLEMGRIYGLSGWSLYREIILPRSLAFDSRRRALLAWLDVGDPDRRRNHLSALRHWLHDDERTRIYADGMSWWWAFCLYAFSGKLADLLAKGLERYWLRWHPAYQAAR